jgi:hypothetical protein
LARLFLQFFEQLVRRLTTCTLNVAQQLLFFNPPSLLFEEPDGLIKQNPGVAHYFRFLNGDYRQFPQILVS